MKWAGLTGGIASGKTTVKKLIESRGFPVIDADLIAHKLTEAGSDAYKKIVAQFGTSFLNSDLSINRKSLGALIFNNTQLKLDLESILHPLIKSEVLKQKKHFELSRASICFYDVPLLFENNIWKDFDFTIVVWCDASQQIQRLMKRNNLNLEEAQLRINNQLPIINKVKLANYCLDNSENETELIKQVDVLLKNIHCK